MARRDVSRVTLWTLLVLACPSAVTAVFLRPAFVVLAYILGAAGVVVPAHLLVRDRPPMHRCPPRHARRGHIDPELRAEVADIRKRVEGHEQAWAAIGVLRRGGHAKRDLRLIKGDGGDDDPEGTRVGLISLHAAG